jgi:hypothetical protein
MNNIIIKIVLKLLLVVLPIGVAQAIDIRPTSVAASSQAWPASNLIDASNYTQWSSSVYADANHIEWIAYWFGAKQTVNYIKLFPRELNGQILGFPKSFNVYWSDGTQWNLVRTYTNFKIPSRADYIILPLPSAVFADGIHIVATQLGNDNYNNYYFQLGEAMAGYDAGLAKLSYLGNNNLSGEIEFQNVGADSFNPSKLAVWNYDKRNPIIQGQNINCPGIRPPNIYAANAVYLSPGQWDIYFGGWDQCSGFYDEISKINTSDTFETGNSRRRLIEHGSLEHVNNGSIVKLPQGSYRMAYTGWKGPGKPNKPMYATSSDGVNWISSSGNAAYLININSLPNGQVYGNLDSGTDINGTNTLFYENGVWYLYWRDADGGGVFWADSSDGVNFTYRGTFGVNTQLRGINDVKKIGSYYLYAYHFNGNYLWYSVSSSLSPVNVVPNILFESTNAFNGLGSVPDRNMVSAGWVTDGNRLFGILYGATTDPALSANSIYARWLQKKITVKNGFSNMQNMLSKGPNTVILKTNGAVAETATLDIYDSDGVTKLYTSPLLTFQQGDIWRYNP